MAKKFSELQKKMKPEILAKSKVEAKNMMAKMILAEMRKQTGMTQEELAEALGIKQPSLSKLESQTDMQISTLSRLVQALGGELELIAHLPDADVSISQFIPGVIEDEAA
jgi:transcriptional regulator with XRE-family HTH domain